MRTFIHCIVLSLAVACAAQAQPEHQAEARKLAQEAITLVDEGKLDEGLALLVRAAELDTIPSIYRYEQAYVHYAKKDYARVVSIIEGLMGKPDVMDRWYQLLANAHDNLGNREQAMEIYKEGLRRFPDSGPLHLELGIMMAMGEKDYDAALHYWEEGIRRDPSFASNYYWAAKMFCSSEQRIWGMIYGEIFLNLEPGTKRSDEISAMLFETYRDAIHFGDDGDSVEVDVGNMMTMAPPKGDRIKLPFLLLYSSDLGIAAAMLPKSDRVSGITTIRAIHALRSSFQKTWREMKHDSEYANVLFDRHAQLAAAGLLESYDYWLFLGGAREEAKEWIGRHEQPFTDFVGWFRENRLKLDSSNLFCRTLVE